MSVGADDRVGQTTVLAGTLAGSVRVVPRADGAVGVLIVGDATSDAGMFLVRAGDGTIRPAHPLAGLPDVGQLILHADARSFLLSTPSPRGLHTTVLPR